MKDFKHYLDKTGEVGFVDQVLYSLVYISGLPRARLFELVVFETGELGQVFSLEKDYVEVLLLSHSLVKAGTKVARTGQMLAVSVGSEMLGAHIDSLGHVKKGTYNIEEKRFVDIAPSGIGNRAQVSKPLETGVSIVDLVVPLGKGQRELVVGDRKTGKSRFLLQALYSQARSGTICVYAAIAKGQSELRQLEKFVASREIESNAIIVSSRSSDPSGLIYLTPFTAMSVAEFYRDKGRDVLVIFDDLTAHARFYREISLLAKRFPSRDSYPGDIFYVHARLLERAGKFKKGSISALPVAETVAGDLSGYIQTNLMAVTDGHIFFDKDLFNQGMRPAINPYLSVTRVGHQAQRPLFKDASRKILKFLLNLKKMKSFMHFGAELGEKIKTVLALGDQVEMFFNQSDEITVSVNISIVIIALMWGGKWKDKEKKEAAAQIQEIVRRYEQDNAFKKQIDKIVLSCKRFDNFVIKLKTFKL